MAFMNRRWLGYPSFFTLIVILIAISSCGSKNEVTVYRDIWGVPHVYGDSEAAIAYGFGYAQAEDRMVQLLTNFRWAEGTLAEAFGRSYAEEDYVQRLCQHAEISQEHYADLPPKLKGILEAFVAGIGRYQMEHPEKVPDWAPKIQPWHPVALGRAFIWGWPLDQALDDLRAGKREKEHPRGSNQWAVSGKRTATGAPIALIDPHLSWANEGHWVEARLHGGQIHSCGICVVGTPLVGLGHNRRLSWAATTGGPDCGDVFAEEINPQNPLQYRYDNQWREIAVDTIRISVKTDSGMKVISRAIERTHHGPIYERDGNVAYALAIPYWEQVGLVQQMYEMNLAQNLDDFKRALEMRQFMPQNIMVADQDGNIYYQRTGRVPIRDLRFDWNKPVPGNTSESEWQGIHPTADLVQLLNPEIGFMQNCNISPGTMLPSSPMLNAKYRPYIYNDPDGRDNPRGKSAVALLSAETRMTFERAQEIATDPGIPEVEPWQAALKKAFAAHQAQFSDIAETIQLIISWNGRLDKESENATLYRAWRNALSKNESLKNPSSLSGLTNESEQALLEAIREAQKNLTSLFGSDRIPWGNTVVLKRGDKTFPLSGGSFENGVSALRSVWGANKKGVTTGTGGQSGPMVISLTKPIQSVSVLPWGQSDDPNSAHYMDQGEKLFSQGKFKDTWFEWEELKDHIESKARLDWR